MKILIPEKELKELIANYLREQLPDKAGEQFDVNLTATRGPDGHCAEINIEPRTADGEIAKAPTPVETEETEAASTEEAAVDPFGFDDD